MDYTFHMDFGVKGDKRRRLVDIISTFTQCDKKYLGAPTFAYEVDYFTIDKNGVVSFDSCADSEEIEGLLEILAYEGFVALTSDYGLEETDDESNEDSEDTDFSISLPSDKVNTENLTKLFETKGVLIKKALGIESSPIIIKNDIVTFPWFKEVPTPDEIAAYTHFITAICEMTKKQKRINTVEKETDNEKYAFRCFLLRLGFIGAEYKTERKILLRNLEGSAAFKSGARKEVGYDVSE